MRRHIAVSDEGLGPGSKAGSVRASIPAGKQGNGPRPDPSPTIAYPATNAHQGTHSVLSLLQPMGSTALLTQCPFPVALRSVSAQCQGW